MIDLEIRDGIATCVMNGPPANTINPPWCAHFHEVIDRLEATHEWRVLHIKSALKLFCAGADLKHVASGFASPTGTTEFIASLQAYRNLFDRIESLRGVTFAEIGGAALGGGLELALACDLRLVAQEAIVGLPEVKLGLLPAIGGTQRLTALCGKALATRLILTGETVQGADAVALGIAQWSAASIAMTERAKSITEGLAAMPRLALQNAKACIRAAGSAEGCSLELSGSREQFQSQDTQAQVTRFLARNRKS
jgi:enoyl-CoA hydratase/carnithine racemase